MTEIKSQYYYKLRLYNIKSANMSEESSVEVFIRLQPPQTDHLYTENNKVLSCIDKKYCFDYIFPPQTNQEQLFLKAGLKVISNAKKGYNSCIFVYGQTGSGKTYTMTGSQSQEGLIQRTIYKLWPILEEFHSFELKMSYYQIYNEQVNDLLQSHKKKKNPIKIKESLNLGFYFQNLQELKVQAISEIVNYLQKGLKNRTTAETKMNRQSSRSHSIFSLFLTTREKRSDSQTFSIKSSKIHFVDLAGSEKQKSTLAAGERLKEASSINKSLTSLSIVIQKLSNKSNHIPYRDSILTKILRDSLGGNSRTILIATLSSKQSAISQTISTINFAAKAKKVKLTARINEQYEGSLANMRKIIQQLQSQIKELKSNNRQGKLCDNCLALQRDYQELEQKLIQIQNQNNYYKNQIIMTQNTCQINNRESDQDFQDFQDYDRQKNQRMNNISYQISTVLQQSSRQSGINSKKIPIKYSREIHKLQSRIINLNAEICLKNNQIQDFKNQLETLKKSEIQCFQPILKRFSENLSRLRMNQCRQQIELAQFQKIKLLQQKNQDQQSSHTKEILIFRQAISELNKIIQKMSQSERSDQNYQKNVKEQSMLLNFDNSFNNDGKSIKSKKNIINSIQEEVFTQNKDLTEEIQKLQLMYSQAMKKMQDLQLRQQQMFIQIQENKTVANFWQKKYNKCNQIAEEKQYELQELKKYLEAKKAQNLQLNEKISQKQIKIQHLQIANLQKDNQFHATKNRLQFEIQQLSLEINTLNSSLSANQTQIKDLIAENNLSKQRKSEKQQQKSRFEQHIKITTQQFNKILRAKQNELEQIMKQLSQYYIECSQLTDTLKTKDLLYTELRNQFDSLLQKYQRVQKKYKDLKQFIKEEQTTNFLDHHKIQEENTLLRDNLERYHQRIQFMKEEFQRKNQEIEYWKKQYYKQKKWVEDFSRLRKQLGRTGNATQNRKSQQFGHTNASIHKNKELIVESKQDQVNRKNNWEIGQAKIQMSDIVDKICKVFKLKTLQQSEGSILEKLSQLEEKIRYYEQIKNQNQALKARNKLLSEQRNSDFFNKII